jgi:glycosyltransferase involved in cell wall biosynthesis
MGDILRILLILFIFVAVLQTLYYWLFFRILAFHREKPAAVKSRGVSVVICARNEYRHLQENLPAVLEQDHPDFEVVVVNHASDDDSSFLLSRMAEQYPNLKIVEIRENLNFFTGKKFPLSIGIKSASNELILLTDADCKPAGRNWLSNIQQKFEGSTDIVLGYGGYEHHKNLLNWLIRFDTAHIAIQYLSYALAGIPYMGVGRNMAYRKSLFYENKGFISHYRINSGDDDLFINRVANRMNTSVIVNPESFTISEPKKEFREWVRQKRRHLSTGGLYRFRHKLLLGSYSASMFLFYLLFILLLSFNYQPYVVLGFIFLRLTSQLFIFSLCLSKLNEKRLYIWVPFLEVFFLLFNTALSFSNIFSKPDKWK